MMPRWQALGDMFSRDTHVHEASAFFVHLPTVDGRTPPGSSSRSSSSPSHDVGTVDLQVEIEGSQRITGVGKKGAGRAALRDLETSTNQPTNDLGKIRFPF